MARRIGIRARGMLIAACLLGEILGSRAASAADGPKEVEAERIVLKDKNGKVRMVLGMNAQGDPEITMQDVNGMDRLRWV